MLTNEIVPSESIITFKQQMKRLWWNLHINGEISTFIIFIHIMLQSPLFLLISPREPQARQASPSISMSPMGQWMRWFPTCLGEPRRTEASWRVPKRRGSCCGRSWNADLPLGSFSTDRYTENTEEETKRRVCQPVEFFLFLLYFSFLSCLVDSCCCGCLLSLSISTVLPGCTFPVPTCPGVLSLMDSFCRSLSFSVFPPLFLSILFLAVVPHL